MSRCVRRTTPGTALFHAPCAHVFSWNPTLDALFGATKNSDASLSVCVVLHEL
jgi:hypothetical protein